jgi:hypothetical protein
MGAPATAEKRQKKKFLSKKVLVPAAVVVVAAIVALVLFSTVFKADKYIKTQGANTYNFSGDEFIFIAADGTRTAIDAGDYESFASGRDGKSAAFILADEDYELYSLYYSDGGKPKLVAEGDNIRFVLAASGSALAYAIYDEGDNSRSESVLSVYSGGKSTQISKSASSSNICVSPDGKAVAFISDYDEDDGDFTAYVWNGKSTQLGKNKSPAAISNGGKLFYYFNKDRNFYVQKGDKDDTKQRLGNDVYIELFNADSSQVIFTDGGSSYISRDGGEKQKLSGEFGYLILPRNCAGTVTSFANTYYLSSGGNIVRIDKKFATENVVRNTDYGGVVLADDEKTILYMKSDDVYRVNAAKASAEPELLARDVGGFIPCGDGKSFFYVNEDEELYFQKGTGKPKRLADLDDLTAGSDTLYKGKTLYYADDGELRSTDGDTVVSSGFRGIDGDVTSIYVNDYFITVQARDRGDYILYISRDGKNFDILGEY